MTSLVGPVLIFLGLTGLAYGVYIFAFANRDKRSSRQKNLDAIAEMRGDKPPPKRPSNPAKGTAKK
jgi:hypothetical protein